MNLKGQLVAPLAGAWIRWGIVPVFSAFGQILLCHGFDTCQLATRYLLWLHKTVEDLRDNMFVEKAGHSSLPSREIVCIAKECKTDFMGYAEVCWGFIKLAMRMVAIRYA